jgi:CRP-like cAMP-binding protein
MLIIGSMTGGLLFVVLDEIVNQKGGYLRKTATTITFTGRRQKTRMKMIVKGLSKIEILRGLGPSNIQMLVDRVHYEYFNAGEKLFSKGDIGDRMFFIEHGEVLVSDEKNSEIEILREGAVLGEIALVTGTARTANAYAKTNIRVIVLSKKDFEQLRKSAPELDSATLEITRRRLENLKSRAEGKIQEEVSWMNQALKSLGEGTSLPSPIQLRQIASESSSAPMAIWLGIFLDGIPESLVIGASFGVIVSRFGQASPSFFQLVPYTLIAGLFLSNFPESLSSSVGMIKQGWRPLKIIMLWSSIMISTAFGSVAGYLLGSQISHTFMVLIDGVAAGAMLTMISETMIPEAVHLGSPKIVGLTTLAGFLSVLVFKLLET